MGTTITSFAELPSDGMVTVKRQGRERWEGWHIERVLRQDGADAASVYATPIDIATGKTNGASRPILLRFDVDTIETMPDGDR